MYLSYYKNEVVDSQKVDIYNDEDPYFWSHHGREPKEKENLRYYARILKGAIEKKKEGLELSEDEKYSYCIFVENQPRLSYDAANDVYTVSDGRHRMYMLREEGINIEFNVLHFANFREKTLNEVFVEEKIEEQIPVKEEIKEKSIFEKFFDKIMHINNSEKISEKAETKYSNVIDIIAIVENEVNTKLLYKLGIDVLKSYDGYLVVDSQNTNLEELIQKFSNMDVLVSSENIRHEER